jgi:hypothetical protein
MKIISDIKGKETLTDTPKLMRLYHISKTLSSVPKPHAVRLTRRKPKNVLHSTLYMASAASYVGKMVKQLQATN